MNEFQEYSKIFNSWEVTDEIGSGSYGKVFKMQRNEGNVTYASALKVITIPQNDSEIKAKRAEGETQESISTYYQGVTEGLLNEIQIMAELRGNSNIVSYEDHQIIKHEDGIGCDIFIRMELLTSFIDYMSSNEIKEKDIIRLGIDICKALEICEKKNIIHRDIKPGNIFVSNTGDFKLGDFGIARTIEKTVGGLSKKGTYRYMAPEVYKGEPYGKTVDICSLGLVMYYLANGKRTPFLPDAPVPVTHDDEENALIRRMRGEQMMPPKFVSNGLAAIILKACSYDGRDRYPDAEHLRHDLEALAAGVFNEQHIVKEKPANNAIYPAPNRTNHDEIVMEAPHKNQKTTGRLTKRKKILIIILIVEIIVAIVIILGILNSSDSNQDDNNGLLNIGAESSGEGAHPNAAEYNGHYYEVVNEGVYWSKAKYECENKGGHLAIITSQEEEDFIENLIEMNRDSDTYHYWLGATDEEEEGIWKWINGETFWKGGPASEGGVPVGGMYNNWLASQPNNSVKESPNGHDYLEIQVTKGNEGYEEYMTWTDITDNGVAYDYEGAPDYNDTVYYGYICEWDE